MTDPETNKLKRLYQLGQSPWYDNIDRRLIENGELKLLLDMGIVGVTSNPTIFEKAIVSSNVYDEKIQRLKKEGKDLQGIYDELTADDVRDTADMLKETYERTKGIDGYVSIEVLPDYAHDPYKTVEYAKYIFNKIGRKNVMIKVPGTKEAPLAIRKLVREGIPVNATLLFSEHQYETVAYAYVEGLTDRVREGLDISNVASVASVFVSRIDAKVDRLLDVFAGKEGGQESRERLAFLKGKIAIANCKLIYRRFKEIFTSIDFMDLKARGANVQRVLWASTGTKNPIYSDCLYVDNLIGPLTVNTMPHQTVLAFSDHGRVSPTLGTDVEVGSEYLQQLQDVGINLQIIFEEAQMEGVSAFRNSFNALMDSLKAKAA